MVGGRQRRFASLGPGSVFGQVSLIDGQSRSANCLMRHPGVLLEMEQDPCARLFESRSPTALKFLAAVNQGLIAALRGADRRLMRLQDDGRPAAGSEVPSIAEVIPLGELAAWATGERHASACARRHRAHFLTLRDTPFMPPIGR